MNDIAITVKTRFSEEMIKNEVFEKGIDFEKKMYESVVYLIDENVKKALIKLGWTPPKNIDINK